MPRALVWSVVAAGCSPQPTTAPTRAAPLEQHLTLDDLIGDWRWLLRTEEPATARFEDEIWRFHRVPGTIGQVEGRYLRTVEVRSRDGAVFQCNQRPWYRQRAVFDLAVDETAGGLVIKETAYRAEPSPCDHGFRRAASYRLMLSGGEMTLSWDGGSQRLTKIDRRDQRLPDDPWPAPTILGAWRWDAVTVDDDGNLRSEYEWWEVTRRNDNQVDGSYRRRVIVRQPDGKPIACARAASWAFDDAYTFTGQREEEHWRFNELAAEPGDHPCLRATPQRTLDEATGEQLGDFLVLEWRGKRRQVLYRPDQRRARDARDDRGAGE